MIKQQFLNINQNYFQHLQNNAGTLFNYYLKYEWNGFNFWETENLLNRLRSKLSFGLAQNNTEITISVCKSILNWGQSNRAITRNIQKLNELNNNNGIIDYLLSIENILNSTKTDINNNLLYYNSAGFSKIYHLLSFNSIIYDSRVCTALNNLINAMENQDAPNLSFNTNGRENGSYMKNNIRANWLVEAFCNHTQSLFIHIPMPERMRAVEAALFMMGGN